MIFIEQTLAILWKDIRCELRSKQTWMGMGMFAKSHGLLYTLPSR